MMATGEDYRYREVVGGSPTPMNRFMHRYMDHVIDLSTKTVAVRRVLMRAFNILVPPTALFHPRVLFRVLLNVIKPASTEVKARSVKRSVRVNDPRRASKERLTSIG